MRSTSILALLIGIALVSCTRSPHHEEDVPRLVVVAVVDQLRPDLLERYEGCFRGGLRRLLDEGFRFEDAFHDHAITNTAPGHATLGTGMLPSQHGIVDNTWYERVGEGYVSVPAVSDSTAWIPSHPEMDGVSPHNLRSSTLAEWMQEKHPDARVVSVGGKDRSAIFLVGRARGHVYWFSRAAGRFVTSSWYAEAEPDWVRHFHSETWPAFASDSVWTCNTPEEFRALAYADDRPFEGKGASTFPHRYRPPADVSTPAHATNGGTQERAQEDARAREEAYWRWFYRTPRADAAVLEFALTALRAEGLGQDDVPDLLCVAFSSTDVIGHDFGPLSQEQLDNLLHLDRALGRLLDVLDAEVGAGNWTLVLSADHGVGTMPEQLQQDGVEARRVPRAEIEALFSDLRAASEVYGKTNVLSSAIELERVLAARTTAADFVAAAMPRGELAQMANASDPEAATPKLHPDTWSAARTIAPADPFARLYRNSFFEGRMLGGPLWSLEQRRSLGTFGVEARLERDVNVHATSAMHGSPYRHDRHVPLVFLGHSAQAGWSHEPVRTVDMAPTLAAILHITPPSDRSGRPLTLSQPFEGAP